VAEQKYVFSERLFTLQKLRSLGTAAILEVLLALGVAGILIWQQLHPAPPPPPIQSAALEIPPNPPPPPPPPPRSVPTPQPPQPQPLSEVPPIPTPIPTPNAVPVQPPSPPPIPTSRPANPDTLMAQFQASMKAAIDAQKVYPKESIMAGETGVVTISFDYVNGVVSNIHIDKGSGSRKLDRSAMDAVQRATLPPKPAELAGINHFVVLINYSLGG
jgi:protein TonB